MNLLFINHYAGSPNYGMEYRPYYLGREWVKLGHQVTVVAASRSHLRRAQPAVNGATTEEQIEGIRYLWLKTPPYQGNGLRRVLNMLTFVGRLMRFGRRLAKECRPQVVIASSTYPLDIYPASRIARRSGAKLVFEVHDLWPLTPIELGKMSRWHPFIMAMQAAENFACRHADRVVSILPNADAHLREHGMDPSKFVHVPNGIDVAEWREDACPPPEPHAGVLEGLRQEGLFLLGYVGGHALSNALDTLLQAAARVSSCPVAIVLVGDGVEKPQLQAKARQLGLSKVVFLPPVPKPCVPRLLSRMDGLYLGWNHSPLYRFGISPNKLIDYMMAGKPIVHSVEAANDPVSECGCGISCPAADPAALAGAIHDLTRRTPADRAAMGMRGRCHATSNHDYSVLARRFLEAVAGKA